MGNPACLQADWLYAPTGHWLTSSQRHQKSRIPARMRLPWPSRRATFNWGRRWIQFARAHQTVSFCRLASRRHITSRGQSRALTAQSRAAFVQALWAYQVPAVLLAVLWCLMPVVAGGVSNDLSTRQSASFRAWLGWQLPVVGRGESSRSHRSIVTDAGLQTTLVPTKPEQGRGNDDRGHDPTWTVAAPSALGLDACCFSSLGDVSRASVRAQHHKAKSTRGPPLVPQSI
jgi:hypothetical protein